LHTVDAPETINRIIGVFPPYQQRQVRMQLAAILKGVVSQRLVPRADGKGRVPAVEVMVSSARVRELVEDKDKTKLLRDTIQQGYVSYGMQTFDQSLLQLLQKKLITFDEALRQSSNPDDFKLKVSGISSTSDMSWEDFEDKSTEAEDKKNKSDKDAETLQLDRI
jgi:twitching motility protein PilT